MYKIYDDTRNMFLFSFLNLIQIEDFDLLPKWMMIFAWFILEKPKQREKL